MKEIPFPSAPGVYVIENTANGRIYVGKTVCLANRFAGHMNMLKRGSHHNKRLQADWNEFEESAFVFRVHVLAGADEIDSIERALIAENMGDGCFNWSPVGGKAMVGGAFVKSQITLPKSAVRGIRVRAAMADKSIYDYVREILTEHMKKIDAAGEVKA
ncbi:GIY-YIG nuclease family protein [Pararobbsia alpina]|uniref:GIY-YIG domain-containing protein n=1 Tax=Pararobbsia alpina TaxID=621374 RepID=A0A6S7B2G0_9BURK|nr:GIY-YIG nuclease family protein [Pararobbsia alpina]CAB3783310.1 hypothetical protein LMG28138_01614 [Pararobbsia alpina]